MSKMTERTFQNPTEEFVYHLSRETFLSLWSYSNPQRSRGKELCDVLVVCDPDVIVISVKNVELNLEKSPGVAMQRWHRSAVEASVKQIYGAVRWLEKSGHRVIRHDGTDGLPFPPGESRRVHRLSVSLGSGGHIELRSGDYGKGFVHVLDERAVRLLMGSLDTIADFVDYLTAKEELAARCPGLIIEGEENLLAIYLHHGRKFPSELPDGSIPDGLWERFTSNPAFRRRLQEDEVSHVWDRLLEYFGGHALEGTFEFGNDLTESEKVFREMARESRFGRRLLGRTFKDFLEVAEMKKIRARMLVSLRGVGYVFMKARRGQSRDDRLAELQLRALVARGKFECEKVGTVIGICVNVTPDNEGYCEEVVMLRIPEWTEEHARQVEEIKSELGFFAQPTFRMESMDEYPSP